MAIKQLSVADLEMQGPTEQIWALNSSAESVIGSAGEVLLYIPRINGGQSDALFIPQTWLPVNLTSEISRTQLLASSEIRQAVNKNLITLISSDTAKRLMQQEGAKEERARLTAERNHIRSISGARTISDSKAEIVRSDGQSEDDEAERDEDFVSVATLASGGVDNVEDGITPSFKMWTDKINGQSDGEALNALRSRSKFTRKELRFIVKHLENHPRTVAAITAKLGK